MRTSLSLYITTLLGEHMSMRTSLSLYITTLSFYFLASFPASFPPFCRKEIYFHGNLGTYQIGGASPA